MFFTIIFKGNSQQIPNSSHIVETKNYWNPAFTAVGNEMITDAFFRMQWIGFSGAPMSGMLSYQNPFTKMNMSAGAILHFDQTGPISKMGIKLNYAYKLKEIFNKYDQFSLGISANFQQFSFDPSREIVNDRMDAVLNGNRVSSFFPAAGLGLFYMSSKRLYKENVFYFGLATNQAFTTEVLVNNADQKRENHIHFNLGGKIYNYNTMWEPSVTANLVAPDIIDVLYGVKFEMQNAFWAGLGYASSGIIGLQGGVIVDNFGNNDGMLKLGILGSYGLGNGLQELGPSAEFYIGYYFEK